MTLKKARLSLFHYNSKTDKHHTSDASDTVSIGLVVTSKYQSSLSAGHIVWNKAHGPLVRGGLEGASFCQNYSQTKKSSAQTENGCEK